MCPAPLITEEEYRQLRQADGQYYANNGPDTDRVFHFFPKLPDELQLAVWKEAVNDLPVPKLQAFDFDIAHDPEAGPQGRARNGLVACFKPKRTHELRGHVCLLMACVDSRKTFLDAGGYHMLRLSYLVGPSVQNPTKDKKKQAGSFEDYVHKTNTWFDRKYGATQTTKKVNKTAPLVKKAAPKSHKNSSQVNKAFANVLFPVRFEDTRFLIDQVAKPFAYKSIQPSPLSRKRAFTQAAGLDFIHQIKKLAFSIDRKFWIKSVDLCDWFIKPDHYRHNVRSALYSLGALEELSYVSASAADRQCCIGADDVWNSVPTIAVREFDRQPMMPEWHVSDLDRLHLTLMRQWYQFDKDFNSRWGQALRQKCTCRR